VSCRTPAIGSQQKWERPTLTPIKAIRTKDRKGEKESKRKLKREWNGKKRRRNRDRRR
jgi:hypothetical protein